VSVYSHYGIVEIVIVNSSLRTCLLSAAAMHARTMMFLSSVHVINR